MDELSPVPAPEPANIHHKLGQLTRQLHDTLRELGVADGLRHAALEIPDAKSRLSYIARLTGEAAHKVLNQVEQAKQEQDLVMVKTQALRRHIASHHNGRLDAGQVMTYLQDVEHFGQQMQTHLTEIMMAQDFHDLTGQVIARVVHLASVLEDQLVQLTLQTAPITVAPAVAPTPLAHELAGPVVDQKASGDVVTDQSQVDDLLASLGF